MTKQLAKPELDSILTVQFAVAWAGEAKTDPPRLKWWKTAMAEEFGGEDLFRRLAPQTWRWAVLQALREAARRTDAEARARHANPDALLSLYHLGFEVDEWLEDRLQELKLAMPDPNEALPGFRDVIGDWDPRVFAGWLESRAAAEFAPSPTGRRLKGDPPVAIDQVVASLAAGLLPLHDEYPLPYFERRT